MAYNTYNQLVETKRSIKQFTSVFVDSKVSPILPWLEIWENERDFVEQQV